MTQFWLYAAGLIVLAMAFIVLPLLRSRHRTGIDADELNLTVVKQQLDELDSDLEAGILDQARYDAARRDLERELLSDVTGNPGEAATANLSKGARWMALSALLIPLVALLLYQFLGSPQIIRQLAEQPAGGASQSQTGHASAPGMEGMPPLEDLVGRLAAKLEAEPDNAEGWMMLGRSYIALNRYPEAMQAFDRALKLNGEDVSLLLAYAEAIAGSSGNDFTGRAVPLIEKARALEPDNPNVLWMSGIVAYQQGDFQAALDRWTRLQAMLAPQSSELESVSKAIDDARSQLGLPPVEPALPSIAQARPSSTGMAAEAAAASSGGGGVEVKVSLSPELAAKAGPNDLVFIYAKAVSGPPMPLAAARKRVSDLPLTLRLDDSMAMMPQMKISGFQQVVVGARVSLSGSPTAQSGDLEGEVRPVTPGQSEPVEVVIDSVHR